MLRIRLTRTGRTKQESFRIVVAEHARPVKGKFIEIIGYYHPAKNPKIFTVDKDRVNFWIKNGAKPSSSVAGLLKRDGMPNMESYMFARPANLKKKSEIAKEEKEKPAEKTQQTGQKVQQAPAEAKK